MRKEVDNATAELDNSHNTSDMSLPVDIDFSEQEPFIEQQQQLQEEEEQQHQHQQFPTTTGVTSNYLHSWPKSTKKRSRVGDVVPPLELQSFEVPLPRSSAKKIFAELSIVKGLQDWQLLQIYNLFTEDERKFESFMALPNHLKRPWVLMQIRK